MWRWPNVPAPRSPVAELADFAELKCWQEDTASLVALSSELGKLDENEYTDGVPEEDPIEVSIGAAFEEVERRREACRTGYPFVVGSAGNSLRPDPQAESKESTIYKYLLLATRLNMNTCRRQAGIDGADLFEDLAAEAAQAYFGDRTEKYVFGTHPNPLSFRCRVAELCRLLGEGNGFRELAPPSGQVKDDNLDIVVWKHFTDGRAGKLIAFGQCKTGTSYHDDLAQLQPEGFCGLWLRSAPFVLPLRLFLVAEAWSTDRWERAARTAGVLFDRCRIVDFSSDVSDEVMSRIEQWTAAAACTQGLPG